MLKLSSEPDRILIAKIQEHGQGHIFDHWDDLSAADQKQLLAQLHSFDLPRIQHLIETYLRGEQKKLKERVIQPARGLPLSDLAAGSERHGDLKAAGEQELRGGKLAVAMSAGGPAMTGCDQLKGNIPIGPVSGKTLFRLYAEKVCAASKRYRANLPFFIVTSQETHEKTLKAFQDGEYFGLARQDVKFLQQESLPVMDRRGHFLTCESGKVAMHPTGHGAALMALLKDETFQHLEMRGIQHVFFFQSDNPLVQIADPLFLGFHAAGCYEVTSKAVLKTDPEERLGVFCQWKGAPAVIEHTELSDADRQRRLEDGSLAFAAGNAAMHLFSMEFLGKLRKEKCVLPYHLVEKACPHVDKRSRRVNPLKPNSIHFETFIFDAIPLASRAAILEASRQEEFSPIKNLEGPCSPETARQALCSLYQRWLLRAGAEFSPPLNGAAEKNPASFPVEISPLFAMDAEELRDKVKQPLLVKPGMYLENAGS